MGLGKSKDGAPCPNAVTYFDAQLDLRLNQHVNPRTKFDQAHALTARKHVAGPFPEYDTSGE